MKQSSEKILAIVVLSFGVMYIITTLGLPRAPVGNPMSPLYFPIGLGILMSVLGFLMLIRTEGSKVRKEVPKRSYFMILTILCACFAYAMLFKIIGFVASTMLFLVGLLFLLNGYKKWLINIIVAISYTFGIWYVFEKIFMISLP
ncbi:MULTISPECIES: tripartite tricarboxylate transporter TctB family protein [Pseudothermotoga]|jgi:putative tricarboxylic transport membrane protein|uniref:Putative tricarboxylate transport protein TctB n=2 Tax=Pseudothermotoga TaxID=1643951 RepID=A8F377_PSELT|nr:MULTISPECIES: tripartite tricarboxylate transporter TctB family protein [Pseudothermotoga]ABV32611.1 putative tricarboxylate transport protein TctB [Pseudothermotoga lettingae TMO]KUK21615.1 MAG: Putative tricarboxylate transport protein TctB [Pseudothermotoga lettingae]GLI48398.1 hypothetical protein PLETTINGATMO_05670 [Pseudothermotoga lettingae TMO]HBT25369.1 tripartite tricarboxylate transporter TctB family protein [Pseudothermotoga sp.]